MADMSIAILIGRLTRDAELKYTNSGQAICHFSVATSTRKKKGDQWVDEASFWDVDLWGRQGESLNQYLTKGKQVGIEGTMRQDRWEQDGQPRMKVVINANSVQLLGGGQNNNSQGGGGYEGQSGGGQQYGGQGSQGGHTRQQAQPGPPSDDFSDDIPF